MPTTIKICVRGLAVGPAVAMGALLVAFPAAAQIPTAQNIRAVDRGTEYYNSTAAADAATEKVFQSMSADFLQGGEMLVSSRIGYYESLYPNSGDDSYWANYLFTSPVGGAPGAWVGLVATNQPGLPGVVPGSYLYNWVYRIAVNAQSNNSPTGLTTAVWQDVALNYLSAPVFNYAIFYNGTLEFSDCPPMVVNGRVHGNANINVGCTSSGTLTFNSFVDCAGIITNPPAAGFPQSSWVASNITYQGTPSPGHGEGEPVIALPIGTNSLDPNSVREIINPPAPGESVTNPISSQRYYNKADMVIIITNALVGTNLITNTTSVLRTNAVFIYVKNSMYDSSPLVYAVTNGLTSGTNNGVDDGAAWANWVNEGFTNWLSFTNTFFDQRQSASLHVVQIDLGKLGSWIGNGTIGCTNVYLTSKWNATTPFNGIIYVQDLRNISNPSNIWMNCVRLVDGQNITNGLYQTGLTLATQNPLYVMGMYNCPSPTTNFGSTNTIGCRPCSVICDALTILSPAWTNAGVGNYDSTSMNPFTSRPAVSDTVNTAIITGNVPTTDTTATGFSGGVQNLPRMLEDWSGHNLYLNTSLVCLYNSVQANQQFQLPGNYYVPPTRYFSFDLNFQNPATLPPGTPSQTFVERLDRITPSPTADPSQ